MSGSSSGAVALGDSITDGDGSLIAADRRRPDRLAERLRALPVDRWLGLLDTGHLRHAD
ncbi:hypothetical protein [Streptomyces europaeiscabiei]|uniref:hypothetical protein n=1 Tax=Streptomyces europaeiscabiei TaxID=146819 RepID=UPI002E2A49F5|nr:hypothetical protein [Streptomyces europaeiscabiei]